MRMMKRRKKQLHKKRIVFGISALVIAVSVFTSVVYAVKTVPYSGYPTDDSSKLSLINGILHPGAGEQYVHRRITLDGNVNQGGVPIYFDARNSSARPSFFQASKNVTHSVLASLYDLTVVDGPLFIGLPLGAFQSSIENGTEFGLKTEGSNISPVVLLWTNIFNTGGQFGTSFSATLQKVNVAGAVRSSALAHQSRDTQRVCVDEEGVFTLNCGVSQSYHCVGTVPSHASLCSGDDQGLTQDTSITLVSSCTNTQKCEYTCKTGYHLENGVCVAELDGVCHTYTGYYTNQPATDTATGCDSGTYQDYDDNPSTDTYWDWRCVGENGGATANCQAFIKHGSLYYCMDEGSWNNLQNTCYPVDYIPGNDYPSGTLVCADGNVLDDDCYEYEVYECTLDSSGHSIWQARGEVCEAPGGPVSPAGFTTAHDGDTACLRSINPSDPHLCCIAGSDAEC